MDNQKLSSAVRLIARTWRLWAGLGALVFIVMWTSGACTRKVTPGKVESGAGTALRQGSETYLTVSETINPRIDVVGTVTSEEKIHLSARMPAYVKRVSVSAGDAVKVGQELIALDDREIREQLLAAEAQLGQAETEFNRTKRLVETDAATAQSLETAASMYHAARANVDGIKVMLTYATIASPINGIVTDRRVEAGDLANPGQVLLSVYDPENMRLEAPVPVRLTGRLSKGARVEVVLEHPPGTYAGTVTEFVSEIDPTSRTRKARIHLEGTEHNVLPGTFGRVWVDEAPRSAILIPRSAVYSVGQLEMVQVANEGKVHQRLVTTGATHANRVEILSGLNDGEELLVEPIKEN